VSVAGPPVAPKAGASRAGRGGAVARAIACAALVSLLGAVPPARAAGDLGFTASVDQTTVGLGETFQLQVTVQGTQTLSAPKPELPALPDFNLLGSSSSQSTSISIINGRMQQQVSITFTYSLSAKRLGQLTIPPCRLSYQGQDYATQPITMTVVKAPQGQAAPMPQATPGTGGQVPIEGNLLLSAVPDRRTVYVGEPVMLAVSLATRLQVTGGSWESMPSFDGFWVEDVYEADRLNFQRQTIGGREFAVSTLKRVALFPLAAGDAKIKPLAFNATVMQGSRDFFGMFGQQASARVESKPLTIHVLPLPETGRPAEFTGGVGRFTMTASLDHTTSTNSEPVNLVVRIAGTGNVKLIEKPAIAPVQGLRILDPEVKDDDHVENGVVQGTKTLRYPIIPQADGKFEIPPIKMAYFDPKAKTYRTLEAGPLELTASGAVSNAPVTEASGLKVLGTDIAYIKSDASSLATTPFGTPWWPNVLYLASLGTIFWALWYRGHRERLLSDRGYARRLRSSGLVRKRLREAEKQLKSRDERGFHAALAQAVTGYLGDRFDLDAQALTREQLRAELDRRRVKPEVAAAVMDVLERCDVGRFSPGALGDHDSGALFQRARDALGQV